MVLKVLNKNAAPVPKATNVSMLVDLF